MLEDEQEMKYKYDTYLSDCFSSALNLITKTNIDCEAILPRLSTQYTYCPLSLLTNVSQTKKEKQHYKFATSQTISGIADCIQVYYSYTIEPKKYSFIHHFIDIV